MTQALPEDQHGHPIVSLCVDSNGDRDWMMEDEAGFLRPLGRLWSLGNGRFRFEDRRPDATLCNGWMGTEANLLCLIVRVLGGRLPLPQV